MINYLICKKQQAIDTFMEMTEGQLKILSQRPVKKTKLNTHQQPIFTTYSGDMAHRMVHIQN